MVGLARKILGLILILSYVGTTFAVIVVAFNVPLSPLNPPPTLKSYFLVIPIQFVPSPFPPDIDFRIALNISYFDAIVVNQQVNITGIAELQQPKAQNVDMIWIFFQDALFAPSEPDAFGVPLPTLLILTSYTPSIAIDYPVLGGFETSYWNHEGSFSPHIQCVFKNGTINDFGVVQSASIQVKPQEQLLELRMNYVNLVLAYAIFILTALGVTSTVIGLWTGQPTDMTHVLTDSCSPKGRTASRRQSRRKKG